MGWAVERVDVVWSRQARKQLSEIHRRLISELDSPAAAQKLLQRIIARGQQITAMPSSGRALTGYGNRNLRELLENPYRIIYLVGDHHVTVISVFHQRRLLTASRLLRGATDDRGRR